MRRQRSVEAGVTLIEMLAALAVSAMIGLASFTLLESILRTEEGVKGRIDALFAKDRSFQVFALDMRTALDTKLTENGALRLRYVSHDILWRASDEGLVRSIQRAGVPPLNQKLLTEAASLHMPSSDGARVVLTLTNQDIWRQFALSSR